MQERKVEDPGLTEKELQEVAEQVDALARPMTVHALLFLYAAAHGPE